MRSWAGTALLSRRSPSSAVNFVADLFQGLFATANQKNARAKHREVQRHRTTQPGAAASEKYGPIFQHVLLKHSPPPEV